MSDGSCHFSFHSVMGALIVCVSIFMKKNKYRIRVQRAVVKRMTVYKTEVRSPPTGATSQMLVHKPNDD